MKIGILTLGLYRNYGGGLLQAYALQTFLRKMGHDAVTVNYCRRISLFQRARSVLAFLIKKYVLRGRRARWGTKSPTTTAFIRSHMEMTTPIYAPATLSSFRDYDFDGFVVGSDQCWRNEYVPYLPTYFLDFLGDDKAVAKIAYAASFGKNDWSISPELSAQCAVLAKKFDAISVREDSGIKICKEKLGVDADLVLDPTFLLSKEEYEALITPMEDSSECAVGAYILDMTQQKEEIISKYADENSGSVCVVAPEQEWFVSDVPSVSRFVALFKKSQCIITDSFHGMVFSLIFEKPFLVIANKKRGLARFESLLGGVGLMNRLVSEGEISRESVRRVFNQDIDWECVRSLLGEKRNASIEFLKKSLKGKSVR